MKIIGPHTLYMHESFKPFTDLIVLSDSKRTWNNGVVTSKITDTSLADVATVIAWCSAGGEVENFPCFIRMTDTAYAKDVPEGIPERSYVNEAEETVIRKWSEWGSNEHNKWDTFNYFGAVYSQTALTGSELTVIYDLPGVTLLTAAQYNAARPEESVE